MLNFQGFPWLPERWRWIPALGAGALTVFAFAPWGHWPIQIAALSVLFLLSLGSTQHRSTFLLGWAFGFAAMAAGVHWLFVSLHVMGGMPAPLAALAVALLAAGLGLLYGAALLVARCLAPQSGPLVSLLLMATCWMLAEWVRCWLFTGFPWLASGYAHNSSPLAGYAPLVGVFGVGWLASLLAAGLALALHAKQWRLPVWLMWVALLIGGLMLTPLRWTQASGSPISVRLLQGNVPQNMKFSPDQLQTSLSLYQRLITQAPADLIVSPETALPLLASNLPPGYLENLAAFGQSSGSRLLIGLPWTTAPDVYFNSLLGMADGQVDAYRYDKHHLVPFGEFIPLGARWFVDLMQMPLGDFTRGALHQPAFQVKSQWVLPNICYEDLFGEEIAAQLAQAETLGQPQASVLLNVSNIAWFGDTIALPQHLQISQMRALETGRPMLRATNTGATAVVDSHGKVQAQLAPFTEGSLSAEVQGTQGLTPYVRFGNALPVGLACLLVVGLAINSRHRRKTR